MGREIQPNEGQTANEGKTAPEHSIKRATKNKTFAISHQRTFGAHPARFRNRFVRKQAAPPTLEALAASEEAAEAQEAADTSCGVLEEGQADEAFLGDERETGQRSESKNNSVDL